MINKITNIILLTLLILLIFLHQNRCYSKQNELHIAVSSNFLGTLKIISKKFEDKNKYKIIISSDSTTNLFTKIKNGAPFDIFISADAKHPILLEKKNNKSIIYAHGKITLWKKNYNIKKNTLINFKQFKYIGLANPKLSPYGNASQITYKNINIKNNKFILGININQTFYFINSKNNDIGIIALSHTIHNKIIKKHIWKIPQYLYPKIEQRMIILNNNKNNIIKNKFIKYIIKKKTKNIIKQHGYKITDKHD